MELGFQFQTFVSVNKFNLKLVPIGLYIHIYEIGTHQHEYAQLHIGRWICMYTLMYIFIRSSTYIHTYPHRSIHSNRYMETRTHTSRYMEAYLREHKHMHAHINTHMHTYTNACVHKYTCVHKYIHRYKWWQYYEGICC